MPFKIVIDPRAIIDISEAVDYYNSKQVGLGEKFKNSVNKHIETLAKNPYYAIRYKDFRCLPISKFPYLIVFFISENDNKVFVNAVFNTYQNTKRYPKHI